MFRNIRVTCAGLALALATAGPASAEDQLRAPVKADVPDADEATAIGRVHPGNGAYCTGALIARNVVVTAAHCLVNQRSKRWVPAGSLHFLGGYSAGSYAYHARVARYEVSPAYDPTQPAKHLDDDWAILLLTAQVPEDSAPLRVGMAEPNEAIGEVFGYQIRRKYMLSTSEPCRVRKIGDVLIGQCEALKGMSGGPLIDVSTGDVIGIQVASGRQKGRDFLVAVPSANWMAALDSLR